MFNNIGDKIKTLALIICIIGMAASVIGAIAICWEDSDDFIRALLTAAVGCLASWVGSFCLYGFGELIEETAMNRRINEQLLSFMSRQQNPETEPTGTERAAAVETHESKGGGVYWPDGCWNCRKCGTENKREDLFCRECGEYK